MEKTLRELVTEVLTQHPMLPVAEIEQRVNAYGYKYSLDGLRGQISLMCKAGVLRRCGHIKTTSRGRKPGIYRLAS